MDREKIKDYWNERAEHFSTTTAATTNDIYLRELEIKTTIETLLEVNPSSANVMILDVGCGDGYSTIRIAAAIQGWNFTGVDYSQKMLDIANRRLNDLAESEKSRINFKIDDATKLDSVRDRSFDIATTFRCLINLESIESQSLAIEAIADCLKPNGCYIAIENFVEGNDNLNAARRRFDLPDIPVRWHNRYFAEQ